MEGNEDIIILDAGNEGPSLFGPEAFCCMGLFTFYKY